MVKKQIKIGKKKLVKIFFKKKNRKLVETKTGEKKKENL